MVERFAYATEHLNPFRRFLLHEPRGHHGMVGCIVTPPVRSDSHLGVIFMDSDGFSDVCGPGIVALVTALVEAGHLPISKEEPRIVIDSVIGQIVAEPTCSTSTVDAVSFQNVPSFVVNTAVPIELDGRSFPVDIAFGGAFYAIVNASDLRDCHVERAELACLQGWGTVIKQAVESVISVQHPTHPEVQGIYGVIITDSPTQPDVRLRSATLFGGAQLDRSPSETGTCALMATLFSRGGLSLGETYLHEGIIGSRMTGMLLAETVVGPYRAVIPQITARAFVTGFLQLVLDASDPLAQGFLLR